MSDETTLLPCPFCGGEARCYPSDAFNEGGHFEFVVQCSSVDNHTLVNDYPTEAEAIAAWNTRAHGTLTAEQVSKAVYAHSIHADCADADWQAIADELNATVGNGTCEPKWTLQGTTQTQEFWRCECGICGYEFGVEDRRSRPWQVVVNSVDVPNYCPECGTRQKAVKR